MMIYSYRAFDSVAMKSISWRQSKLASSEETCEAPCDYSQLRDIVMVSKQRASPRTRVGSRSEAGREFDVRYVNKVEGSEAVSSVAVSPFLPQFAGVPIESHH